MYDPDQHIRIEKAIRCSKKGEMNIYSYYGHGSDVCLPSGLIKLNNVPKDCTYINRTGCGLQARMGHRFGDMLIRKKLRTVLANPFENRGILGEMVGGEVEIHPEGDDFVESRFYPLGFYPEFRPGSFMIFLSGMRDSESFTSFPTKAGKLQYPQQVFPNDAIVPKSVILQSFEGAIYPTPAVVRSTFTKDSYTMAELDVLSKTLSIHISKLMKRYPGIHYNLLCRSASPTCKEAILKQRALSATKFRTQLNAVRRTLKFEKNVKNVEKFLGDQPKSFYKNLNLVKLEGEIPAERIPYLRKLYDLPV